MDGVVYKLVCKELLCHAAYNYHLEISADISVVSESNKLHFILFQYMHLANIKTYILWNNG